MFLHICRFHGKCLFKRLWLSGMLDSMYVSVRAKLTVNISGFLVSWPVSMFRGNIFLFTGCFKDLSAKDKHLSSLRWCKVISPVISNAAE